MKLTVGQPIGNIYHNFGTFAPTPNFLLRRPCSEISSSEKLVMARLIQYCDGKGECWPSQKKLGQEVGLGELMVQKCLKRLQEIGLVKCFPPTGKYRLMHMHNTYVLLWHEWMEETAADLNDNNSPELYNSKSPGINDSIGASKEKSGKEKSGKEASKEASGVGRKSSSVPVSRTRSNNPPNKSTAPSPPYDEITASWNAAVENTAIPKIQKLTNSRRAKIKARMKEFPTIEDWEALFKPIVASDFCCGDNDRGWTASFDWLVANEENPTKVLEGKYTNKKKKKPDSKLTLAFPASPENLGGYKRLSDQAREKALSGRKNDDR